jgi:hypothetical protein
MRIGKEQLQAIGINCLSITNNDLCTERIKSIFKGHYGCSISTIYQIWNLLVVNNLIPPKGLVKHLYWALGYMKTYETYIGFTNKFGCSEKTFRKWVHSFIRAISSLKIVSKFPILL